MSVRPPINVVSDTSDFMRIDRGDVINLGGRELLVSGSVYEPRFGLEDQPKYWVKRGYDLDSGHQVIIKMVFYEEFEAQFGSFRIPCYRSPHKEATVLGLVKGDSRFMQGRTFIDDAGNDVRVLELIPGKSLFQKVVEMDIEHEEFHNTHLASIPSNLVGCLDAIQFLHSNDLCHGDVRSDHVLIDDDSGAYRWIDFDLCQDWSSDPYRNFFAYDVWNFGSLLWFVTGMGPTTFHDVRATGRFSSEAVASLALTDAHAFYRYRLLNLKKVYPHISERLNAILMRFAMGAGDPYWTVAELTGTFAKPSATCPPMSSSVCGFAGPPPERATQRADDT